MSPVDLSWMPAAEEWDFRPITPAECGLACYWEYTRALFTFTHDPYAWIRHPKMHVFFGRPAAGEYHPPAWTRLSAQQRLLFGESHGVHPGFWIGPTKDVIEQDLEAFKGDHRRALENLARWRAYVVWADFRRHGTEKIIADFTAWARAESKKFPAKQRGKASVPPFDCLKWLSAYRLEEPRRKAGVNFAASQECLREFQRKQPVANVNDVLPLYASHGAWSKAVRDAKALLSMHEASNMDLALKFLDPIGWIDYQALARSREEHRPG
jgi:hypothetical protein